ncbi:MAG TPA: ATP-binding cassette domain-containing protein [Sunxiuqinia sp.]|nr:ATP-binding cassette domain-containing protein [Sunxiuqinia sp.]
MTAADKSNSLIAKNLSFGIDGSPILQEINFELKEGESVAITGASGSGKSLLGKVLAGDLKLRSGELLLTGIGKRVMVDQQDHFIAYSGRRSMHYSQRYEKLGMESVPSVLEFLNKMSRMNSHQVTEDQLIQVMNQIEIAHLTDRKILELSNGERKRTQLAIALLQQPDLLILDQPFVGLDIHSREKLNQLLQQQMELGVQLIVICDPHYIPGIISKVLELKNGRPNQFVARENYEPQIEDETFSVTETKKQLFQLLPGSKEFFDDVVAMCNVNVQFGEKAILEDIDWQVKNGEQWALLGPNGAGKTTLLSLVTADNPQGYNNHLVLFDRQRGTGESIWNIKKRIGFVSPELHLYFLRGAGIFNTIPGLSGGSHQAYSTLTCREVIQSGFHDDVGFNSANSDQQVKLANTWLSILGLEHLQKRLFTHASLGEQRSLLLARALVKSPQLFILDEPCQGLDGQQTKRFTQLLDAICEHLKTTMIYVTHHPEEIPACVSHLLELKNGRVKSSGEYRRDK